MGIRTPIGHVVLMACLATGCTLARSSLGSAADGGQFDSGMDGFAFPLDMGEDVFDVGADMGPDVGPPDVGPPDVGPPDVGPPDAACAPYPLSTTATATLSASSDPRPGGMLRVDYSGFPGATGDWIEVSELCSDPAAPRIWAYTTGGTMSGTVTIPLADRFPAGTYELRGLFGTAPFSVQTKSQPFQIAP